MFSFRRPIRFEDVDAAGIVFFARYLNFCHEAMEAFFSSLSGGYVDLILKRKLGLPAVKVELEYHAPLRYGDAVRIEVTTARVGKSSAVLRYLCRREADGAAVATILHTVVLSDLTRMKSVPMPDDVRNVLLAHVEA